MADWWMTKQGENPDWWLTKQGENPDWWLTRNTPAPVGALTISDETATDGDLITFNHTIVGATVFQLYKDGIWVYGGDTLPLVLRVGPLDVGNYTIVATGPGGTLTTAAVALAVAANDLLLDNFTSGSVSASWTSTSGTNTVTSQKLVVNAASSGYLEKAITGNKVRIAFTIDPTSFSAGSFEVFTLLGTGYPIVTGLLLESAGTKLLRFSPNVGGYLAGSPQYLNFSAAIGYSTATLVSGVNKIEIYWDIDLRIVEIYVNELAHCIVTGIVDHSVSVIEPPRTFRVGVVSGAATGTVDIDAVSIKTGDAALTPYSLGSKWAILHVIGQSNGVGAELNTYNSTTDAIGGYLAAGFGDDNGTAARVDAFPNHYTASSSTQVSFAFLQGIDLPANFRPVIINNAVGSTSFQTTYGWADTLVDTGLYRRRAIKHSTLLSALGADVCNLAIWHQGFEGDTNLTAVAYTALLAELISDYRTAIGDAACPVIIGGFSPAYLSGGQSESAGYITIEGANSAYAAANNGRFVSSLLPTALTFQAGLGTNDIHFDAAGYRALGTRGAAKYLELNPAATP